MRKVLVVWAVSVMVVSGIANAGSIGINMGADRASLDPTDIAGVAAQGNWNNGSGGVGSASGLMDDAGAITSAGAAWTNHDPGGSVWGDTWQVPGRGAGSADDKLMTAYIDPIWGDCVSEITLSDIPYAQYDAYVYFGTDNEGGIGYVTDGATTYSYTIDVSAPFTTFIQTLATDNSAPVANYAVFSGLTGSSLTLITGTTDVAQVGGMMGIQIVEVPEPMTLSLLALGGMGLIRRRRA